MKRHNRNEQGAAMVEGAIVMTIVTLLTFALIDIGMYFSAYNSLGAGARDGARYISATSTAPLSDYDGAQKLKKSFNGVASADLQSVVVFKAPTYESDTPASCTTSSQAGLCTFYTRADLDLPEADFAAKTALGWNPPTRAVSRAGGTDLVGVSVTGKITTPIGIFGSRTRVVTRTVVLQLEAERL